MKSRAVRSLPELFASAGIAPVDGGAIPQVEISALADDSRRVNAGDCFVAVRGVAVNGHDFIGDAIERGASCIVFERELVMPRGAVAVRVEDSREALAKLAAAYFGLRGVESGLRSGRGRLPLVGVTGTNGKTTVAWLVRAIFTAAKRPAALLGTIEYDLISKRTKAPLTTPGALEVARLLSGARDDGAACGVMEVSSHALDQRRCDGLSFACGVFTNLSGDHLDYHGSMDAYFAAKRRLFDLLDDDGLGVVNLDDAQGVKLAEELGGRAITFGLGSRADLRGVIESMDRSGTTLRVEGDRVCETIRLSLVGEHNVSNALAAIGAASVLGVENSAIVSGLAAVDGVPGRLQRVEPAGHPFSVFVDYAHTDEALRNALRSLKPLTSGRLICVFGCGGDRDRTKRPRMGRAVAEVAEVAVVTSDNPRSEDPQRIIEDVLPGFDGAANCQVEVDADRRAAIGRALQLARAGDTVVIAGKGHEDYQLVNGRVLDFDDATVASEMLAANAAMEEVA